MDTCYNYVIYNYVNFAWRIFHRMHRFNIESSQPVLAYIALIDVNIKVSLIIHLSMTFVNMLSLRGRRGSGEEREGGGAAEEGDDGADVTDFPRRCRSSGPARTVAMGPYGDGMRDRGISQNETEPAARLRASGVPHDRPSFCSPFRDARERRRTLGLARFGRQSLASPVLRVVATPPGPVRRRRASRRVSRPLRYARASAFDSAWQEERERDRKDGPPCCSVRISIGSTSREAERRILGLNFLWSLETRWQ